ncbi:AI-2E family transporter [Paraflavitalea soli]|uniref:AI-2E family transporter n=1 Tax=Paraflavitalea soli TaxID=2315862 RepID=A0A3B7MHY5_9BACT|nr:AI-2E family transporter [Paraflavitalea soli]AXY72799.1 AI-2E family transporter [Paraflavitalea soli]
MTQEQPFYFRLTMVLLMLALIALFIYFGSDLVVPFALSMLIAILLMPICNFLQRKGLPRVPAILLALLVAVLFTGGIIYFLSSQIASFLNDFDQIKKGINVHLNTVQRWIKQQFGFSMREQEDMFNDFLASMKNSGQGAIGSTFSSITSLLTSLTLLPIYTFLLLYYRGLIRQFFIDVFSKTPKNEVATILNESRIVVQSYMVGLIIELIIVATINSIGFLILGIKYAIFLAVFAAILNILPYIGMLIASIFCMLITLTTSTDIREPIWVLVVLLIVQFIDNNIIMPKIVGSKVKLNALMTIVGVIVGGLLCGISGMFLSIPAIAILKIIFDRIEDLKPWGRLLGDENDSATKSKAKGAKAKRQPANEA